MYIRYAILTMLLIGCYPKSDYDKAEAPNTTLELPSLPDPLEAGWRGEKVCEVVEENEHVRVLKCTFPPGVGHEEHYHLPHIGYTLAGGTFQISDSTGTRTVSVPTGSKFKNEYLTVHQVLNVGETTASFLIIEYKQ